MTSSDPVEGVIPVDKPVGPTSHDVVGLARRALHTRRIGHTGTLDPFASGLLLLCVGRATRIAEYLTGLPKRYYAVLRLGQVMDTDDLTGTLLSETDAWRDITRAQLDTVLERFRGDILQVPSAFSAKQRGGQRAYRAAREGRALALEPVPVRIEQLELLAFEPPLVHLDVTCSSGTYIRALARDIGAALDVGGHLTALRRIAVGPHRVDTALSPFELADAARVAAALIRPVDALGDMPRLEVDDEQAERLRHGQFLPHANVVGTVALTARGDLIAIGEADGQRVRPRKVFAA